MPPVVGVLTGDIVGSSDMAPDALQGVFDRLGSAAETAAAWGDMAPRFTRFRGDGWQCLAPAPALAFRTGLFLQARLRAFARDPVWTEAVSERRLEPSTRIAIGIGAAEVPAEGDLAAASGPAFRIAGRLLDGMGRGERLVLARSEGPRETMLGAVVALSDEITRRWTPPQATIVAIALAPDAPVQAEIAAAEGISQQMVAKHLRAAGFRALIRAIDAVEADPVDHRL